MTTPRPIHDDTCATRGCGHQGWAQYRRHCYQHRPDAPTGHERYPLPGHVMTAGCCR